ncbi:MAG: sensor histidine kinase, partial [Kangiellaceae bacterium]
KIHIETKGLTPEPGQMIVLTDMTKTRQLQDKLSQQHKLSSMGKMIASLAHQIRTPLSAAMIYGSHINDSKLGQQQLIEFSSSLMERLKFMDRQIHDMLQFVRGEKKQKQKVKLHDFICRLNENISIHENVKIKNVSKVLTEINEKKLSLLANEDDLIGAVSNLIENALAASTSDQKVIINISLEKTNDKNPNKNGRYLFNLEVVDSGLGMAKEQQKLIFEPFYTTKSSGNGLGLSIVQGVVIEHGGQLSLKSELGNGSTFGIKIPLQVASSSRVQTNLKNELIDEVDING